VRSLFKLAPSGCQGERVRDSKQRSAISSQRSAGLRQWRKGAGALGSRGVGGNTRGEDSSRQLAAGRGAEATERAGGGIRMENVRPTTDNARGIVLRNGHLAAGGRQKRRGPGCHRGETPCLFPRRAARRHGGRPPRARQR